MTNNFNNKRRALIVVAHFGGGVIKSGNDPVVEGEHRATVKVAAFKADGTMATVFKADGTMAAAEQEINIVDQLTSPSGSMMMPLDDLAHSPQVGATFALLMNLPRLSEIARDNNLDYVDLIVDIFGMQYLNELAGVIGRPGAKGREHFLPFETTRPTTTLENAKAQARAKLMSRKSDAKVDLDRLINTAEVAGAHMVTDLKVTYGRQWQQTDERLFADEPLTVIVTKDAVTRAVTKIDAFNDEGDQVTITAKDLPGARYLHGGAEYYFDTLAAKQPKRAYTAERQIAFKGKGDTEVGFVTLSSLFAEIDGRKPIAVQKGLTVTFEHNEKPSRDWFIAKRLSMYRTVSASLFATRLVDNESELGWQHETTDAVRIAEFDNIADGTYSSSSSSSSDDHGSDDDYEF